MLWFETLLFYGYEEQRIEQQEEDIDSGLLPAIVERVVLPKLAGQSISLYVWVIL